MSLIQELSQILADSSMAANSAQAGNFKVLEQSGAEAGDNLLVRGDNLTFMKRLQQQGYEGKLKLIYIDPPFYSKANYEAVVKIETDDFPEIPALKLYAYHDVWKDGMAHYLRMLCSRFYLMRDLLAEDGCLWVHLDWHVVHYVKILLDEIFGEKNFVNEIIWHYKSGGTSKRRFSRKHDTLLFYSKTDQYFFKPQIEKSYNRDFKPYRFKGVKEYQDERGWYTLVNMKDVWQLDMVGRTAAERNGYATQKPLALLERIIESCTREGDLCADFFGGSGTLAVAAAGLKRNWISCDQGSLAFACTGKRLLGVNADFSAMEQEGLRQEAAAQVRAETSLAPAGEGGRQKLQVKLLSYLPDLDQVPLAEEDRRTVQKIIHKDSLCLIDYWSVDFYFDGQVHRPELILQMGKTKEVVCEKIGADFKQISLHLVDIFGNSTYQCMIL